MNHLAPLYIHAVFEKGAEHVSGNRARQFMNLSKKMFQMHLLLKGAISKCCPTMHNFTAFPFFVVVSIPLKAVLMCCHRAMPTTFHT